MRVEKERRERVGGGGAICRTTNIEAFRGHWHWHWHLAFGAELRVNEVTFRAARPEPCQSKDDLER